MLPNFAFWVMVAAPSCRFSRYRAPHPGAIAPRPHLSPRASSLSFSSFVSPLRPLGLGLLGRCGPRSLIFLRRYGRRSGQPSSSSLARRACVHYSGSSAFYCVASLVFVPFKFVYWDTLNFGSAPGLSGGRGEMAMAVASSARLAFLRGAVCACCMPYTRCFPFWSLYSDGPMSSRPQPLGRGGDVAPCEDTREDLGPWFNF